MRTDPESHLSECSRESVCCSLFELFGWMPSKATAGAHKQCSEHVSAINCAIFQQWITGYCNSLPDIKILQQIFDDVCIRSIENLSVTEEVISPWGFQANSISVLHMPAAVCACLSAYLLHLKQHSHTLFASSVVDSAGQMCLAYLGHEEQSGFVLRNLRPKLSPAQEISWRTGALGKLLELLCTVSVNEPSLRHFLHMHLVQTIKSTSYRIYTLLDDAQRSERAYEINVLCSCQDLENCTTALIALMQSLHRAT